MLQKSLNDVWGEILSLEPSIENLRYIIAWAPALRERAGESILSLNPSISDLRFVIGCVPGLQERAGEAILALNPSIDDLQHLIRHIPTFKARVQLLLDAAIERQKAIESVLAWTVPGSP